MGEKAKAIGASETEITNLMTSPNKCSRCTTVYSSIIFRGNGEHTITLVSH